MTRDQLRQKLQQRYDRDKWQLILREVFSNVSILARPQEVLCDHKEIQAFLELGSVHLAGGKNLKVFELRVDEKIHLPHNRVALRNLVARYIDQQTCHGVLAIFVGSGYDYRFTFVAKESEFTDDGEFVERQTATKRFTYLLGPHETCTTAARRFLQLAGKRDHATLQDVVEAFSVEKLNIEFFDKYKEHYEAFVGYLLAGDLQQEVFAIPRLVDAKEQDKANKPVRDFAKRLLGRLVFLHFLQKKGWLGCTADRTDWADGDRDFVSSLFLSCPDKGKFYSTRLVPLFFEALNRPDRPNDLFSVTGSRVPYLNGGLFEHERLPNGHGLLPVEKLDFPAALFQELLEFFAQYNFTIDENDPDDHEVGIDPEMLGHIFENLLEDNKDKGAFYTPKPIVQYMCQQSLIYYLQQHLGEREALASLVRFKDGGSPTDKNNWARQNARRIEELLDSVKICDPAIGSGAFPIGLLQEIYWIKLTLDWTLDPAETKLKIIQNSIYGVDIDAGAVEIARLRFWLSLIVDEEKPRPLPNLDYKIMQGDSLLESFEGIPLDNLQQTQAFKVQVFSKQGQGQMFAGDLLDYAQSRESSARAKEITALINRYFSETNPAGKQELHKKIDRFVLGHIDYNLQIQEEKISDELTIHRAEIKRKAKLVKGWKPPKKTEQRINTLEEELQSIALKKVRLQELEEKPERPYFLWHLFFQDVFEQGGFDMVIANPPYISVEKFSRTSLQEQWKAQYKTYASRGDIYCFFYERGINLLKENGVLCFISSNKFMRAGYGEGLRKLLVSQKLGTVIDFCELPVFAAATDPSIVLLEKTAPGTNHQVFAAVIKVESEIYRLLPALNQRGTLRPQESLKPEGWTLEGQVGLTLLEKLRKKGTPLDKYVGGRFYYGVKTGLNNAFVINQETRDRLIKEDPKSAELIRKWIRGKDITRWRSEWNGWYAILFPYGFHTELKNYPAILRHLSRFEKELKARGQCQTSRGGKDEGQHHWLELDNNPKPEYLDAFNRPKIIFADIGKHLKACFDESGLVCGNTAYIIPEASEALLAVLLSKVVDWYSRMTFQGLGDPWAGGRLRYIHQNMAHIPIPEINDEQFEKLETLGKNASNSAGAQLKDIESKIDQVVYSLFELSPEEIAIIERTAPEPLTPGGLDNKAALLTRILSALKEQSAYFSLAAVKRALAQAEIELADDTLREYMSEAMNTGIVSDAGRSWYSHHVKPVRLDYKPVTKVIREVKKAFPILDFCCWSTVQFNPFAQHLIAQPTIFLYAESDTLDTIAVTLKSAGWDAWANPGKADVERYVRPGEKTVVLRPSIAKQPECKDHEAPIEKALIDLIIESVKLQLMDVAEVQRILDNVLGAGLLQLPVLLGYAETKREKIESKEITH